MLIAILKMSLIETVNLAAADYVKNRHCYRNRKFSERTQPIFVFDERVNARNRQDLGRCCVAYLSG